MKNRTYYLEDILSDGVKAACMAVAAYVVLSSHFAIQKEIRNEFQELNGHFSRIVSCTGQFVEGKCEIKVEGK